jgi:hypothetical protein
MTSRFFWPDVESQAWIFKRLGLALANPVGTASN